MTAEPSRRTSVPDHDIVVFLIGMRINRWRSVKQWLPVLMAMPKMLRELGQNPDLGLLHARTFVSGRTIQVNQYWRSADDLLAYSRAADHQHLPAWKAFNRRARTSTAVGIFHETYVVRAADHESISVNMPDGGLLVAIGSVPVGRGRESASERLGAVENPAQVASA